MGRPGTIRDLRTAPMTYEIPAPSARRVRRPSLRDPRLAVGVLLVVGSVALGSWFLADADRGESLFAARSVLTPGQPLDADDLEVVEARVPEAGVYLAASGPLPEGAVVTRVVGAGELVPVAAVGAAAEVDVRPVGVQVPGPVASGVVAGAVVDLWLTVPPSAAFGEAATPPSPALVAAGLRVAAVQDDDALLAGSAATTVEVLVPQALLPTVLAALATDGVLTLVPVPGGS